MNQAHDALSDKAWPARRDQAERVSLVVCPYLRLPPPHLQDRAALSAYPNLAMFRTSFLARSVARRSTAVQPTTAFTRQYAIGSKQPSTATTQSADSSIKTPSRPQSETVRSYEPAACARPP